MKESLGLSLQYTLLPSAIKSFFNGGGKRPRSKLPDLESVLQHFSRHLDYDLIKDTNRRYAKPKKFWHKWLSLETTYYLDPQNCK